MQHVLVCTDDPVLAKRVRFLLARDECDVQIVDPAQAGAAATQQPPDLLVVSSSLASDVPLDRARATLVLGGTPNGHRGPNIHVLEDVSDAQGLYGVASRLLNDRAAQDDEPKTEHAVRPEPPVDAHNLPMDTMIDHDDPSLPPADGEPSGEGSTQHTGIDPGELAKVIFKTHSHRSSGVLVMEQPEETLRLEFENGAPVRMASSVPGDRFGRDLVSRGRLTEAQYAHAAKRAIEAGMELGRALVESQVFSESQLSEERAEYARLRIVDRFKPVTGSFKYERGAKIADAERTFSLDILPVVAEGFKLFASKDVVRRVVPEREERYFQVKTTAEEVGQQFVLTPEEVEFLRFGGRAYNVADAAEMSGLELDDALKLLALLWTCEKVEDFTPGIEEFEARIKEERRRTKDLEVRSQDLPASLAQPASLQGASPSPSFAPAPPAPPSDVDEEPLPLPDPDDEPLADNGFPAAGTRPDIPSFSTAVSPPPAPGSNPSVPSAPPPVSLAPPSSSPSSPSMPISSPSSPPPPPPAEDAPSMPVPAPGQEGVMPEPMAWANPLPRAPDGSLMETPQRSQSREHFQRGVQLLGQGQFDGAEQAFREAVALCSEEHVYLVGLARAIFYNPNYRADGKLPLLSVIVGRAEGLARDDKRVQTLRQWVQSAEREHMR